MDISTYCSIALVILTAIILLYLVFGKVHIKFNVEDVKLPSAMSGRPMNNQMMKPTYSSGLQACVENNAHNPSVCCDSIDTSSVNSVYNDCTEISQSGYMNCHDCTQCKGIKC